MVKNGRRKKRGEHSALHNKLIVKLIAQTKLLGKKNAVNASQDNAAPVNQAKSSSTRAFIAKTLNYTGAVALTAAPAAAGGFWLSQAGIQWLPTMLSIITAVCFWALIAMTVAQFIGSDAVHLTEKGWKMRKRIKTVLILVVLAGLLRIGTYCISQPCELTRLADGGYENIFENDLNSFYQCDKGLAASLESLDNLEALQEKNSDRTLTPDEEATLREIWQEVFSYSYCLDSIGQFHDNWHRFDPSQEQKKYHLRSFLLKYGSELLLYEYGRKICEKIGTNSNAVKFLNAIDDGAVIKTDSFSLYRNDITNSAQSARISTYIGYYLWLDKFLDGEKFSDQIACTQLWLRVSDSTATVREMGGFKQIAVSIGGDAEFFKRKFHRTWLPLQTNVATWMGNTRVRRNGVYLIDDKLLDEFSGKLQCGDILLSRKNWYLSNVGLPGFWPHAILYVGSPAQMRKYFDDPQVYEFISREYGVETDLCSLLKQRFPVKWQRYANGHNGRPYRVIEALSAGVVPHTMRQTRGDFLAALRPELPKESKAAAIIEAFEHMDKPYDYDFDFATDHALVCTELVWRCYRPRKSRQGLTIEPIQLSGRKTLPANEIAKLFVAEHEKAAKEDNFTPQLKFVGFLDASEATQKAHEATLADFLTTTTRSKWSATGVH